MRKAEKNKPVLLFAFVAAFALQTEAVSKETFMVLMRDGETHLATDVYLPQQGDKFPTLLMRTPYNKDIGAENFKGLNDAGIAIVAQDMRGRHASEGVDPIFFTDAWGEHQDGVDTLDWIASQEWSNGLICSFGGSALGINQYLTAGANPQNLTCQVPMVAAPSLYHGVVYYNGVFRKRMIEGWLEGQKSSYILPSFFEHYLYDEFWSRVDLNTRAEFVNAPAYHIGGWYDIFAQETIDAYRIYQHQGGSGARGKQFLLIGPWTHGGINQSKQGELIYPKNAEGYRLADGNEPWVVFMLHYFFGGIAFRLEAIPPVVYYLMGDAEDPEAPGNEWISAEDWPPPYEETLLYLSSEDALSFSMPREEFSFEFTADPENPVQTICGSNLILPPGPCDQRKIEEREDVLVFSTEPLREPITISGPITAKLYVSTDAPDTDFTARLTDVYPDGRSMLVVDGVGRLSLREGLDRRAEVKAGEVYPLEIRMASSAIVFNKGHRVRLIIAGSNYPRFELNPNTGDSLPSGNLRKAKNKIHISSELPSALALPTLGFVPPEEGEEEEETPDGGESEGEGEEGDKEGDDEEGEETEGEESSPDNKPKGGASSKEAQEESGCSCRLR